jgi:hypothetical protein
VFSLEAAQKGFATKPQAQQTPEAYHLGRPVQEWEKASALFTISFFDAFVLAMLHPSFTARSSAHRRQFKTSSGHLFLPRAVDRPDQ